ncbi:MAG: alcohol dehydrogenase, partial [Alphaproteobacteria bacterium]
MMARIGDPALRFAFQIVVDGGGRLLGTVTDGDIRRAILRGRSLADPATDVMNRRPKFSRIGLERENLEMLRSMT